MFKVGSREDRVSSSVLKEGREMSAFGFALVTVHFATSVSFGSEPAET